MSNDFLPKDYQVPKGTDGLFMKFKQGANKFRILCSPVIGYEWWEEDTNGKHPVRVKSREKANTQMPDEFRKTLKHFWGMLVWNYEEEKVQILQITQITIMQAIGGYNDDADWGSPLDYDLVIKKSGERLDTQYQIIAKPKKELDEKIKEMLAKNELKLEKLFEAAGKVDASEDAEIEYDEEEEIPF